MFSPQPLRTQAVSIIKKAIISGELEENELITERLLFEKYHISKTPLREALQTLEAEGWVNKVPYKGTYVNPITKQDIEDIFELRIILEAAIVKQLESFHNNDLQTIKDIHKKMVKQKERLSAYDFMLLDESFHEVLYLRSENARMLSIFEQLRDSIRRIGIKTLYYEPRRDEIIKEHQRIIEGFTTGEASQAIESHLLSQKQVFISLYEASQ